jgi:hypothetical protein
VQRLPFFYGDQSQEIWPRMKTDRKGAGELIITVIGLGILLVCSLARTGSAQFSSGDERRLLGNTKQGRSTWDYFRSADLTRWVT